MHMQVIVCNFLFLVRIMLDGFVFEFALITRDCASFSRIQYQLLQASVSQPD